MKNTTTLGFGARTKVDGNSDCHVLQLTVRLLVLGIIKRGYFTWINFQHDDGCPTIRTSSSLDCFCNCEAVIAGQRYSFNKYVRDAERVQ
jgi:hypothetical protein